LEAFKEEIVLFQQQNLGQKKNMDTAKHKKIAPETNRFVTETKCFLHQQNVLSLY